MPAGRRTSETFSLMFPGHGQFWPSAATGMVRREFLSQVPLNPQGFFFFFAQHMDPSSRRNRSQDICGTLRRLIPFEHYTGDGKSGIIWSHCILSAYIPCAAHNNACAALCCHRKRSFGKTKKKPAHFQ